MKNQTKCSTVVLQDSVRIAAEIYGIRQHKQTPQLSPRAAEPALCVSCANIYVSLIVCAFSV